MLRAGRIEAVIIQNDQEIQLIQDLLDNVSQQDEVLVPKQNE